MKFNMLFISAAVLFCLTAQIFSLTDIASAAGCGVNPLGDTSGDADFYVSKNQNLPTSGGLSSAPADSNAAKASVALGTSAEKIEENATVVSLNPDKASPQVAGSTIVWTANATNQNDEEMLYDFSLKGPATNGELIDKTGWIGENSWTWNTTKADVGENQVQVRVMRLDGGEAEAVMTQNYTIATTIAASSEEQVAGAAVSTKKSTSTEMNPHPGGKTADSVVQEASTTTSKSSAASSMNSHPGGKTANIDVGKPRLAPDEKKVVAAAGGLADEAMNTQDSLAASSDTMDVGGKWTVDLIGSGCTLDIKNLIQTGDSIVGMGDLIERNTKIPQTFKGTVTSTSLRLRSKAVIDEFGNHVDKSVSLYLEKEDRAISGNYELYSGDELTGKGNATASRFTS